MALLIPLGLGLLFGFGLLLSGMTDPGKVQGFLDIAGHWDPSLALVMGGAIGVALLPFQHARARLKTWLGMPMQLPTARQIDRRLIVGSTLFGIGWGLAGICPGPGLVLLGLDLGHGALFVGAMLAGMGLQQRYAR
ncbi:DUF6691 family protein [Dechloromonas sp. ZS-1]|uniref:DUF6691 family protein n=1 Tax=Dechloromonas sp. ZS-1 TaxID=3138067 RepID=UPI0031FDCAC4